MAHLIVDLPIKHGGFPVRQLLVYQRVSLPGLSTFIPLGQGTEANKI